jgi:ribosome-binding factor A
MSARMKKVNSLIAQEISTLINREVDFKPGLFITISKVDTSRDLRYTHIFVKVFPIQEVDYAMKTLEHERINLQKILHKKLHLKILPKISFVEDDSGESFDQIDRLLLKD